MPNGQIYFQIELGKFFYSSGRLFPISAALALHVQIMIIKAADGLNKEHRVYGINVGTLIDGQ
jgi:hypothetical protein